MSSSIKPYKKSSLSKKHQIEKMFDQISIRYDFLNSLLSFGIHKFWRKKVLNIVKKKSSELILDLATGTGDLAILMAKKLPKAHIFGVDLSQKMLEIAKKKVKNLNLEKKIELLKGDSNKLPFEEKKIDLVTIAFGIRNFETLDLSLKEIYRVLKENGNLIILEFSRPKNRFINFFYKFYSKYILSKLGKWISKDPFAYHYLYESSQKFPYGKEMEKILIRSGFSNVKIIPLSFGIVSIYVAKKKANL